MLSSFCMEQITAWMIKIIKIVFITILAWIVSRYIDKKIKQNIMASLAHDRLRANLAATIVANSIVVTAVLTVLYECGINVGALLAAAGVVGVGVSFAAQTSLSNLISGIFLLFEQPFDIGDTITVGPEKGILAHGTVTTINLFAVIIKTANGGLVRIPHATLIKEVVMTSRQIKANSSSSDK